MRYPVIALFVTLSLAPRRSLCGPTPEANTRFYRFQQAVIDKDMASVKQDLSEGIPVNRHGQSAYTALHLAAARNWPAGIDLLTQHGADPNARDRYGWTPLHIAAERGYEQAARALLKSGAAVNAKDDRGQLTPLHRAALNGHPDMVSLLLRHQADRHARSSARRFGGMTPLHWAAAGEAEGNTHAVALLLETDAKIGLADENGMTALHWAVLSRNRKTMQTLIKAGAPLDAINDRGQTPLQLAEQSNGQPVVDLLIRSAEEIDAYAETFESYVVGLPISEQNPGWGTSRMRKEVIEIDPQDAVNPSKVLRLAYAGRIPPTNDAWEGAISGKLEGRFDINIVTLEDGQAFDIYYVGDGRGGIRFESDGTMALHNDQVFTLGTWQPNQWYRIVTDMIVDADDGENSKFRASAYLLSPGDKPKTLVGQTAFHPFRNAPTFLNANRFFIRNRNPLVADFRLDNLSVKPVDAF